MSIESLDYISQKRFKVAGRLAMKVLGDNIIRHEHFEKIYLNSLIGCERYIIEQNPWTECHVFELENGQEISDQFRDKIVLVKSRHGNELKVSRYV